VQRICNRQTRKQHESSGRLPQYCRNCRKRVAFSFAIANLAVVQFHEGMADESREPFCVSKFWGLRREIDHDSILGMSFWKYWRDRFWESLMTWYGRAQAIGFVLFLVEDLYCLLRGSGFWFQEHSSSD
jgi:hypothetical protein